MLDAGVYQTRLRESLPVVEANIQRARERSGRDGVISLVAVTKGHPVSAVEAAIAVGLNTCGENRVAELESKVEAIGRTAIGWHLIGHLQRNKARQALPLFDLVHSIDSERLAAVLSHEAVRAGVTVNGLVQVNASGEVSKGGIDAAADMDAAQAAVARICELPNLRIDGLMTMAPLTDDESVVRQTFRRTRELFDRCAHQIPSFNAQHVSMGMSGDYEVAVEEGSTMLRLGTILFGERVP